MEKLTIKYLDGQEKVFYGTEEQVLQLVRELRNIKTEWLKDRTKTENVFVSIVREKC